MTDLHLTLSHLAHSPNMPAGIAVTPARHTTGHPDAGLLSAGALLHTRARGVPAGRGSATSTPGERTKAAGA